VKRWVVTFWVIADGDTEEEAVAEVRQMIQDPTFEPSSVEEAETGA